MATIKYKVGDRTCSSIDNERIYEFVRHMSKKEFEETMNRQLHPMIDMTKIKVYTDIEQSRKLDFKKYMEGK